MSALSQQLARVTRAPPANQAVAAAASTPSSGGRPARVRVSLWRFDPTQPMAPLTKVELVVEDVVLFSEWGCDFSPDGGRLVVCAARAVCGCTHARACV